MDKHSLYYAGTVAILRNTPLFNDIDDELFEDMLSHTDMITVSKKSIILSSEVRNTVFIILSGRVKVSSIHPKTGREYIITLLEAGDAFNMTSLLENAQTDEENMVFEAIDNLQLLCGSISTALDWLNKHPEFNKNFFPYLAKVIRTMNTATEELALHDTMTRLVKLILKYADLDAKEKENTLISIRLIHDLPHEVLAQMIGSARKVVNQNLQTLKKEGSIVYIDGHLFIKDITKLIERT
ncbi:transcriptional regulator, Crp/Fnr family (plasmid) [Sulfuricurvum kujiense DSM 16994]|uniref:Transcriptional regulator, Crp/Fnr family n=1 Tax=Sulfuricurvum kujiense (strain ATCC BAA-921 / DSM 16994 / JCM 11577 / YK-1) TaxID=709032 RepID=E4U3N1_SULKY|nr:Crp/Fnr family transcriptional regulator [Sulfuricurvum kujiense]ADR35297.1 transcriptional regulator, Crp/Fnr family [Sulfuricurvum kujiense DSM 16994]